MICIFNLKSQDLKSLDLQSSIVPFAHAQRPRRNRRRQTSRDRAGQGRRARAGAARTSGRGPAGPRFLRRVGPARPDPADCRGEEGQPEQGRHSGRLRSGADRRDLSRPRRGLRQRVDRRALFPGESRLSPPGPRGRRPARAAEGLHRRSLPGRRSACGRGRRRAADRRMPRRRLAEDAARLDRRVGHDAAGRAVRAGQLAARRGRRRAIDRHQQPRPANLQDRSEPHARTAPADSPGSRRGRRERHPHARRRPASASGRRGRDARRRDAHGAAPTSARRWTACWAEREH